MKHKGKVQYDKGGRPYRVIDGVKAYLTWQESYERKRREVDILKNDLHNSALTNINAQHRLQWKQDEIDKLKREVALYQVGYLQEKEPLQDAISKIARVIIERERYTKKQMMDRVEEILLSLGTNVPQEELEKLKQLEELANEH